ncbi:MAG: hypothetical protein J5505_04260 [Spirochaetaceae bacterium]|nr:hypothetical protein [Spirochaetaceae bacterium]
MKARLALLSLLFLILLSLTGCQDTANKSFTDSITVYETWADFQKQKDAASCKKFIDSIENFEPEKFNSYPILKSQTKNQMKICLETAQSLLEILEASEAPDEKVVSEKIEQIDLCLLAYLRNQNFALQDTQQKYFSFFMWLLATIIVGGFILIYLNIREIKKKDLIIYNSEQFLKHSMEVQEAERRRISRELHDTVAQSMRYVSLLAEGLQDKETAGKIITTQNDNIESIRKLCYNLTPPNISAQDMVSALELLGQKIFGDFQLRIVVEDSVDFSVFTDEQLMNIYRIVQEAFQNIKKHAAANEVTVLFKKEIAADAAKKRSVLKIIITDDGQGMNAELVSQINSGVFENTENFHFGVRNIVERVQLLGGTVSYRSEEDCGTQITIVL